MNELIRTFASRAAMASIGLLLITLSTSFQPIDRAKLLPIKPFAVVELFTSEGCSSCPPADRLLSQLVDEAEKNDLNIFALSFHVSYWNYLGWKDPFSDERFNYRQNKYSKTLKSRTYTPQMVVNGSAELVGSQKHLAEETIASALRNTQAIVRLSGVSVRTTDERLYFEAGAKGITENKVLHIAIVEKNLTVEVNRGENRGRKLHHDNVVRVFKSIDVGNGSIKKTSITLPPDLKKAESSVIFFIQDQKTMQIYDASSAGLTS